MTGPALEWSEIYRRLHADRGDPAAHQALERRVRGWAQAALGRHGWHVVEDVVADTCSAVVLDLARARGPATFKGFVLGLYLNVRRRLVGQAPEAATAEALDQAAWTFETPAPDEVDLLRRCLDELPSRERLAVTLRFVEDAAYKLIADALKITEVNARQIVFVAVRRLRDCGTRIWPEGRG